MRDPFFPDTTPLVDFHNFLERQRSEREIKDAKAAIDRYEEQIDRLTLACMAMWSIIKEKLNVTEEDFIKRIEEIDKQDGQLDGKLRIQVSNCPQCHRAMSVRHNRCLYCGYTPTPGEFQPFTTSPSPAENGASKK